MYSPIRDLKNLNKELFNPCPGEYEFHRKNFRHLIRKMAIELGQWYNIDRKLIEDKLPDLDFETNEYSPGFKFNLPDKGYIKIPEIEEAIKKMSKTKAAKYGIGENTVLLNYSSITQKDLPDGYEDGNFYIVPWLGEEIGHFLYSLKTGEIGKKTAETGLSEFFGRLGYIYFAKKLGIPYEEMTKDLLIDEIRRASKLQKKVSESKDSLDHIIDAGMSKFTSPDKFKGIIAKLEEKIKSDKPKEALNFLEKTSKHMYLIPEMSYFLPDTKRIINSLIKKSNDQPKENYESSKSNLISLLNREIKSYSLLFGSKKNFIKIVRDSILEPYENEVTDIIDHLNYFFAFKNFDTIEKMTNAERGKLLDDLKETEKKFLSDKELEDDVFDVLRKEGFEIPEEETDENN